MTTTWQVIDRGTKKQRVLIELLTFARDHSSIKGDEIKYRKCEDFEYMKDHVSNAFVWVPRKQLEFKKEGGIAKRNIFYSITARFKDKRYINKNFNNPKRAQRSFEYYKKNYEDLGVEYLDIMWVVVYDLDCRYTTCAVPGESGEEFITF